MSSEASDALLTTIGKARGWIDDLVKGRASSFAEIAQREGKVERHIRFLAPLAFVSPRFIIAIIDGSAPADLAATEVPALFLGRTEAAARFAGRVTIKSPALCAAPYNAPHITRPVIVVPLTRSQSASNLGLCIPPRRLKNADQRLQPKSDGVTADPVHAARMRPAGTVLTYGNVARSFPTLRQRPETLLVGWGGRIRTFKFQSLVW